MTNKPLVSILIPVYKVPEKYLRGCIESCMHQTLKDIEIIIVDDGSPDRCGMICDEYATTDERIVVIHKKNGGLAAARNTAFDASHGEYVTFLDGDDWLEQNACERAYQVAKEKNVQLVMWNLVQEYPNSSRLWASFPDKELEWRNKDCDKLQLRVLDFNGRIAQVFSKLINRQYLCDNNIRHVDELSQGAEGYVFNIQLFDKLESAYFISDVLLHYTFNDKSISHSSSEKNNLMIVKCMEWIFDFVKKKKDSQQYIDGVYQRMLYIICTTAITGYFNPDNKMTYKEKVEGLGNFMKISLVDEAMNKADTKKISAQRQLIIWLVRHRAYCAINILGQLRRWQLKHR